jgi:hypothetical protein
MSAGIRESQIEVRAIPGLGIGTIRQAQGRLYGSIGSRPGEFPGMRTTGLYFYEKLAGVRTVAGRELHTLCWCGDGRHDAPPWM